MDRGLRRQCTSIQDGQDLLRALATEATTQETAAMGALVTEATTKETAATGASATSRTEEPQGRKTGWSRTSNQRI
jgi:hypothetical protein